MNKTLSIGLAGFSFVIEEHAYIKLSDYLAALRNSLDASEADEVMHDIEIRMVELFKDVLGKREVINADDVDRVINQIGKPEQIEEQEEAYFSEKTSKKENKNSGNASRQKATFPRYFNSKNCRSLCRFSSLHRNGRYLNARYLVNCIFSNDSCSRKCDVNCPTLYYTLGGSSKSTNCIRFFENERSTCKF